jgi:hypothetical protein
MQFIVITAEGTETYDGSYEVEGSGVLKIRPMDRSELISLSPAFWRQINEPPLLLRHARLRLRGREVGSSACE